MLKELSRVLSLQCGRCGPRGVFESAALDLTQV